MIQCLCLVIWYHLLVSLVQISQKVYYDNKNKNRVYLFADYFKGANRASYDEIN